MNNCWEQFDSILQHEEGTSLSRLAFRIAFLLSGFDIQGKRVLDVGCGRGIQALYLALAGSAYVIGIDPEGAGSTQGVRTTLPRRIQQLGLTNCEFLPVAFGEHRFSDGSFDLVLFYDSINHLHEVTSDLRRDPGAYDVYTDIFDELFRITSPGGIVILSDCSRKNLLAPLVRLGVCHPLPSMRSIEWEKHQVPSVWRRLLRASGFQLVSQSWYVPAPLRSVRWLADNWLFNFCTFSHFTLRARRPQEYAACILSTLI